MPQYLAEIKGNTFALSKEEARHLHVARFHTGDEIKIFDGFGSKYLAKLQTLTDKTAAGEIIAPIPYMPPKREIVLCFSAISRPATEDLLDKCTQIGVYAFQPVISRRSDAELLKKWDTKLERWHNILVSACKQCETPKIPLILNPVSFEEALQSIMPAIICYEGETTTSIQSALQTVEKAKTLGLFIGPEGGYTDEEIQLALKYKVKAVSLGGNILRAETAATVASWAALQ
ncbi:MAG: 16S rRNA (uracil(1498)-N(3))-methyltransferase [Elusimicrobiota bacterium]|jgi:16S rRNA (uracil1498-N3)-methyltransferase|nr:16S rRNA (uracil(1498)-N(3))-methyltransferase [Elusimicrobiota bacterium]